jgi:hypothetical protein
MVVVAALQAWGGSWRWRPRCVGVESCGEGPFIGRARRRGGGTDGRPYSELCSSLMAVGLAVALEVMLGSGA